MDSKRWVVVGGVLGFLLGAVFFVWPEAQADRTIVHSTSSSRITHGDFQRLDDGGWRFSVCGRTEQTDGGTAVVEVPCIVCEPGAFSDAPATCRAAWRAANGL